MKSIIVYNNAPMSRESTPHSGCTHSADVAELIRRNPHPILFVVEGELTIRFKADSGLIKQGHFAVVASIDMVDCFLAPSSVIVVFYPPERLAFYLGMSRRSFYLSISEILPIYPPLQEWIDEVLEHSADGNHPAESDQVDANEWKGCSKLVHIFLSTYPRNLISTLFMPLYACSIFHCKHCKV